jgi:hypothetical protein
MRFNETTHIISVCVLILTAIYSLVYSGVSGLLVCAAVGFIAAAFIEQFELVVAVIILFSLFYNQILKHFLRRFEGFTSAQEITGALRDKRATYESTFPGTSSVKQSFMEGFESGSNDPMKDTPAPTVQGEAVDPNAVKDVTAAITNDKKDTTKNNVGVDGIATEEFQSATNELFKLGKMPSEHKEGPMLDAGGTIMKAMSSIDPATTQKMTMDTKQLLETQKSLMNMLTQMRPILSDGKELLQTFGGMFGGQAMNAANNNQFKLDK